VTTLAAAAAGEIEAAGWTISDLPSARDGERHWRLTPAAADATRQVVIVVHERSSVLVCYSVAADRVEPAARGAVAELLTMANYGLLEGNFEVDLGDGEVRFKTSAYVADTRSIAAVVARLINFNVAVFDLYRDALVEVASGRVGPTAALAAVEGG
jgi:hypothetical protein